MTSSTLLPPEHTRPYGVEEAHGVFFQPRRDRGGMRPCVAVMIPEAEDAFLAAMEQARALNTRVAVICDTAEQAERVRRQIARLLPRHREVSVARAKEGGWYLQ